MDSKINPLIFLYICMDKGGHTVVLNGVTVSSQNKSGLYYCSSGW